MHKVLPYCPSVFQEPWRVAATFVVNNRGPYAMFVAGVWFPLLRSIFSRLAWGNTSTLLMSTERKQNVSNQHMRLQDYVFFIAKCSSRPAHWSEREFVRRVTVIVKHCCLNPYYCCCCYVTSCKVCNWSKFACKSLLWDELVLFHVNFTSLFSLSYRCGRASRLVRTKYDQHGCGDDFSAS